MNWYEICILFVVAFVVTLALTPAVKKLAVHFGIVDQPGGRRVNQEPVPRLGGLAILGGSLVALIVLLVGIHYWGWSSPFISHPNLDVNYLGVGISMLVIFVVGLLDDIFDLKPKIKFAGQIAAACIAVASGLLINHINLPFGAGNFQFGWFAYPLTVFYLVAFVNIINLIDGLDGLATGITAISTVALIAVSVMTSRPDAVVLSVILLGTCLGFLRFNYHPASIFMGDCGALFLGYFLGAISLMGVARGTAFVSLMVPIVVAGVPIMDTLSAIVRRTRSGQPIDEADNQHLHHRLLEAGFSQETTVLIMWSWTAILSLCAVLMMAFNGWPRYCIMAVVLAVTAVVIWKLQLFRPVLKHHYVPRENSRKTKTNKK